MTKTVLVVEDEPNIILSLEFLIKEAGYNMRVALDGEEALKAVAEEVPDLLLLDIMIPKRDGYDVCKTLRANPALKDLRIIMLAARGLKADKEKGLAMGADEYITKPFSTRELTQKLKQHLGSED
ncbi:MAG: response regulator [Nitrospiraceae bacterium]